MFDVVVARAWTVKGKLRGFNFFKFYPEIVRTTKKLFSETEELGSNLADFERGAKQRF